jgi:hypothetical protein
VRRFRKKKIFASKRNEAKRDPFRTLTRNFFFFRFLSLRFFASDQSKIFRAYIFALFRFQKIFVRYVPLLFRFVFASFHIRFASDAKTSKNTFFLHRTEKFLLSFCFEAKKFRFPFALKQKLWQFFASFHFEAKMIEVFCFRFASFHFEAKMMEVFCFRFASFRFEAKMMAVFSLFFVLFSLRSIFVSLQIYMFRIDAKQMKKHIFSHRSEKQFASVLLHFASKRK